MSRAGAARRAAHVREVFRRARGMPLLPYSEGKPAGRRKLQSGVEGFAARGTGVRPGRVVVAQPAFHVQTAAHVPPVA